MYRLDFTVEHKVVVNTDAESRAGVTGVPSREHKLLWRSSVESPSKTETSKKIKCVWVVGCESEINEARLKKKGLSLEDLSDSDLPF